MALKPTLVFTNTLSKQKEVFSPLKRGEVSMYTCGPTVYDRAHIGNFRTYIFADTVKRTLLLFGYHVTHIINITDVGHLTDDANDGEDKLHAAAKKHNKNAYDIAKEFEMLFFEDSKRLNLLPPTKTPRATDHIKEQIEMIQTLEKRGLTYTISDGVYFDTSKQKTYGAMAHLIRSGADEGVRIEHNKEKRSREDFALWKLSPKNENRHMEWESPWGKGFPGWHIECSAMSKKYLGFPFDIHTGGIDHIPVHHTNEIAQNEGVGSKDAIRYFLHGEFMTVNGERMGKSLGNTFTLSHLDKKNISPLSFRYLMLSAHYRQLINFTWESLAAAHTTYTNILEELDRLRQEKAKEKRSFYQKLFTSERVNEHYKEQFLGALADDLNTARALAILWEVLKDDTLSPKEKLDTIFYFDAGLGLLLAEHSLPAPVPHHIQELAVKREEARTAQKWDNADTLRKKIEAGGFLVEDTKNGSRLLKKRG